MHSYVTSKNVKWCHLIWPTLYTLQYVTTRALHMAFFRLQVEELAVVICENHFKLIC